MEKRRVQGKARLNAHSVGSRLSSPGAGKRQRSPRPLCPEGRAWEPPSPPPSTLTSLAFKRPLAALPPVPSWGLFGQIKPTLPEPVGGGWAGRRPLRMNALGALASPGLLCALTPLARQFLALGSSVTFAVTPESGTARAVAGTLVQGFSLLGMPGDVSNCPDLEGLLSSGGWRSGGAVGPPVLPGAAPKERAIQPQRQWCPGPRPLDLDVS